MTLARRIQNLRKEAHWSQQDLCDRTGLAVSYLSRLENGKITPSIPTLKKVADAFGVPLTAFFDHNVPLPPKDETCPVSLSGKCILELAHARNRVKVNGQTESYTDKQLEILRECNYLVHTQDKEVLVALSTMMKSLLAFAVAEKKVRFEAMPFIGNGI